MKRRFLLPLLVLFALPLAGAAEPRFHVAPRPAGDDAHDGSVAAPFATLDRARRAVRDVLVSGPLHEDVVVELRAGRYELAAPVRFDPEDSGSDGFDVVYRAAPGAVVELSGGHVVTGWTREGEGLFRAEVGRDVDFRQLWIDGRRAIRARSPNAGQTFTLPEEKQANGFDLPRGQLEGVALQPGRTEISVAIAWMHKRLRIQGTAPGPTPDRVRSIIAEPEWDAVTRQPQGDRRYRERHYWLENAPEFLDAPGEFFLDRDTGSLRYRPRPWEKLPEAQVIRPELETLILLAGRLDAPVHHLRFEGLTFVETGWTRPNHAGFVDVQANSLVPADPAAAVDPQYRHRQRKNRIPAAFQAVTADHIVLRDCRFARLGGTGVMFLHGGDDNRIEGNSFFDLSAGAIELGEDAARPVNPRLFPRRNQITNNLISRIGQDYFGSVAILVYYAEGTLISHNQIDAVPYTGISVGWGWDNPPAPPEARGNRIVGNRVSNYMRRLDDGGGIYTTGRQPGSEIRGNYLLRMLPPDPHTKAGGALYPDQCTEGFTIDHNVVSEAVRWLYIWNPNIRENRVEANYADTTARRNDGTNNEVEPVHLMQDGAWPPAAREIVAQAGLEPRIAESMTVAAPFTLLDDSLGLALQRVSGEWQTLADPTGGRGGSVSSSKDPQAFARWAPLIPSRGRYELSVWSAPPAGTAEFVIHFTGGVERRVVPVPDRPGWVRLGEFSFETGPAEIEVRPAPGPARLPLVLDTLRLQRASSR